MSDDGDMARLGILLFLAYLAVLVVALIDCLSTDEAEIRNLPKIVWIVLILLFSPVGGIAWFMAGRPKDEAITGAGFPKKRPRQVAPDDDPDFLRSLNERSRAEEEEALRQWEEELKKKPKPTDET
jgi:Phospholipase_D-nuclease N-terminal